MNGKGVSWSHKSNSQSTVFELDEISHDQLAPRFHFIGLKTKAQGGQTTFPSPGLLIPVLTSSLLSRFLSGFLQQRMQTTSVDEQFLRGCGESRHHLRTPFSLHLRCILNRILPVMMTDLGKVVNPEGAEVKLEQTRAPRCLHPSAKSAKVRFKSGHESLGFHTHLSHEMQRSELLSMRYCGRFT